ncbi:hypothetical protein RI129_011292 [Pyrocoelia pectoralis]|uniref:Fibrinogen C-terminal domain-containing protein n=1 Tax=Pyrocoelia pectoralis TaxID=417401 RepID=A0AAN7V7S0_9COLE
MLLTSLLYSLIVLSAVTSDSVENGRARPRQAPPPSALPTQQQQPALYPDRSEPPRRNIGDIEYRLTRLEVLLVEKLDNIRNDVRDVTRRLQALEWQSAESQATFDTFRSDISRISQQVSSPSVQQQQPQTVSPQLEARIDNLGKGLQLLVAATRGLTSDVNGLKRNVSILANDTRSFLAFTPNLVTKQFLNNGLLELKHHQVQPWSDNTCPKSDISNNVPRNCREVLESGQRKSGIYRIQPDTSTKPFMVVCDQLTRGGGWTVIQNRFDGTQDFYQNWHDYKHGFGNLGGEFWLGLDNIHQLTGSIVNELLIELQDLDLESKSAYYSAFSIGSEVEGFPLKVLGGYSGDAGDSLLYHAGSRFSSKDMDQDGWPEGSCAQAHGGAWWYRSCDMSNLNGKYLSGQLPEQYIYQGMYWGEFRGPQYSLNRARMLVRPREEVSHPLVDEIFDKNLSMPKTERGSS